MAEIYLNGERRDIPDGIDLEQLLELFALPSQRVAIELNKEVVRKNEWSGTKLKDSDHIEVVHFVGGG